MFAAVWNNGSSQGQAGASQSLWKHSIVIDRRSRVWGWWGACGQCRRFSHHFPRGAVGG